jgi:hypothetical protein
MFDGATFPRFHWFDCNDPAFDSLVVAALGSHGQITARGYSQKDIEIRTGAYRYLLAAMVVSGHAGLPIEIGIGNDKVTLSRYPKGWQVALDRLLNDGWVLNPVLPNPAGSWALYDEARGAVNRPKSKRNLKGKIRGSGGCYCLSAKSWEALTSGGFEAKNLVASRLHGIVVKNSKKAYLRPLPEHEKLDEWLNQLVSYNEGLKAFEFSFDGRVIGASEFTLHRVFNNGGYDQGGRFYSRFNNWSSNDRNRLMIDGKAVQSVDFKNLHGRLSLAAVGEEFSDGDLYSLDGFDRDGVKDVWSAALNARNGTGFTEAANSKEIVKALTVRYPKLVEVLGKGVGLSLQRADSELVGTVLEAFIRAGKPLVPLHDGFYFLPKDRDLFLQAISLGKESLFTALRRKYLGTRNIDLPWEGYGRNNKCSY